MIPWGRIGLIGVIVLVMINCSGSESLTKGVWTATPAFIRSTRPTLDVTITPGKGKNPYYAFFKVTIINNGQTDLAIDWNRCRSQYNGADQGMLVFEGIDPKAVKTATIPPDIIPAGKSASRIVMPATRIAWNPIHEKTAEGRGISPGILSEGEHGIRLNLLRGGDPVTISGSFHIRLVKR